jgi:hypothetical protein
MLQGIPGTDNGFAKPDLVALQERPDIRRRLGQGCLKPLFKLRRQRIEAELLAEVRGDRGIVAAAQSDQRRRAADGTSEFIGRNGCHRHEHRYGQGQPGEAV